MAKNTKRKSNIDSIKDFVNGKYETIQSGWTPDKTNRKTGEIWEDSNGRKWMQKDGYKVNINEQANIIREARKKICSKCNKDISWSTDRLDSKFYKMTGWCFDCIIVEETRLRAIGKYKDYENKKIMMNQLSKCYDLMQELKDNYNYLKSEKGLVQFQNYVGIKQDMVQEEIWGKLDEKAVRQDIRNEYKLLAKFSWQLKKKIKAIVI